jgi:hypothetical protein
MSLISVSNFKANQTWKKIDVEQVPRTLQLKGFFPGVVVLFE